MFNPTYVVAGVAVLVVFAVASRFSRPRSRRRITRDDGYMPIYMDTGNSLTGNNLWNSTDSGEHHGHNQSDSAAVNQDDNDSCSRDNDSDSRDADNHDSCDSDSSGSDSGGGDSSSD